MFAQDAANTAQGIQNAFNSVKNHQFFLNGICGMFKLRSKCVVSIAGKIHRKNKALKPNVAHDFSQQNSPQYKGNLARSMGSFAADFARTLNDVNRIVNRTTPFNTLLQDAIKEADTDNTTDTKKLKDQVQQIKVNVLRLKDELDKTGNTFKQVSTQFGETADTFDKNKSDLSAVRQPTTGTGMPGN